MGKKYNRKYLLTGLLIIAGIANINSQQVYAGKVSELNINNVDGSPKLEWVTEMSDKDILYQTGFEENDSENVDLYGNTYGTYKYLHSLSPLAAFNGSRGYLLNDNSNGKGASSPSGATNYHTTELGSIYAHTDIPIIATFKAKSIGKTNFYSGGDGGYENNFDILDVKTVRNHAIGEKVIYVDSVDDLNVNQTISIDLDVSSVAYTYMIRSIDKANNTITLSEGIGRALPSGENLKQREWIYPLDFDTITLNNTEWKSYTIGSYLTESEYYDTTIRGIGLFTYIGTNGQFMMDDLKIGYATEVEVFRDGTSVYKGYLNKFHDTSLKDTIAPDRIISSYAYENNGNIIFNIDKPKDNGIHTKYQIQTIESDGSKNPLSSETAFTLTSGVKSYNYEISSNVTPSNLSKNTSTDALNISKSNVNIETDYLHIQAVDGAGNISEISTFKLNDIMGSMNTNGQYQQDILLRLLKGDFALLVRDTISFGPVRLTASKQTISVPLGSNIDVIDARGTQQGWKLNVSATPFTEDSFEGFDGTPVQLPLGTLSLGPVETINQIADIDNVQYPTMVGTNTNIIDSGEVTLLQANAGEGMGQFELGFGDNALSIVVDSSTAKIDDVNYPTGMTPYTSTITWNLVTGP